MSKTTWAWVSPLALLAAMALAGCGGGGGGGGGSSSGGSGSGGGGNTFTPTTLNSANNNLSVTFPAGTTATVPSGQSNSLAATPAAAPPPGVASVNVGVVAGNAYQLTPTGTTFSNPATLTFKVPAGLSAGALANIGIYSLNANGTYTEVPGSTLSADHTVVTATTTHFSTYALLATNTSPTQFTLSATPHHGYITLTWQTPADAQSNTTYAIQRNLGDGSGNPIGTASVIPVDGGGALYSTTTASYKDPNYANNTSNGISGAANVFDTNEGQQYVYRIVASTGDTSQALAATPNGPAEGDFIPLNSGGTATTAPFVSSGSMAHFTYAIIPGNSTHAYVTMQVVLDYAPQASDLQKITINVDNGTLPDMVLTNAQIAAGITTHGNEIDFDSRLVSGLTLPATVPYGDLTLNGYFSSPTSGGSPAVPVQFIFRTPDVTKSTTFNDLNFPSRFGITLDDQVPGT